MDREGRRVSLRKALFVRLDDSEKRTIKRGLNLKIRKPPFFMLAGGGRVDHPYERDWREYAAVLDCWKNAFARLIKEVESGTIEIWGIWEKPNPGTQAEMVDAAVLRLFQFDPDIADQLTDESQYRNLRHVEVRESSPISEETPHSGQESEPSSENAPHRNRSGGLSLYAIIKIAIEEKGIGLADFHRYGFQTDFADVLLQGPANRYKKASIQRTLGLIRQEMETEFQRGLVDSD